MSRHLDTALSEQLDYPHAIHATGSSEDGAASQEVPSVKASIDVNGTINALSISPSKNLVAVGGRDGKELVDHASNAAKKLTKHFSLYSVLKIIGLGIDSFTEKKNLRAGKANLSLRTNDVRWHPHTSESMIPHFPGNL